uniref:Uncharacterized protein n=1 Tax=Cacopsylla melanoneura TaxID=428564 RepID=A0A8D9A0K5_9HEMI
MCIINTIRRGTHQRPLTIEVFPTLMYFATQMQNFIRHLHLSFQDQETGLREVGYIALSGDGNKFFLWLTETYPKFPTKNAFASWCTKKKKKKCYNTLKLH